MLTPSGRQEHEERRVGELETRELLAKVSHARSRSNDLLTDHGDRLAGVLLS